MVYVTPEPHSNGSNDTQATISSPSPDRQATAERAAYIASILADWPAPTPQQERTICSLLGNGAGGLTTDQYRHWEIEQYILRTETPGRFGYFGSEEAAA